MVDGQGVTLRRRKYVKLHSCLFLAHCGRATRAPMNVRFEGNNGHDADLTRRLLMTQSGHLDPPANFYWLSGVKAGNQCINWLGENAPEPFSGIVR